MSHPKAPDAVRTVMAPRPTWLAQQPIEPILAPALPIIDAHHHLWDRPGDRYLLPDLLADTGSGHDVRATVFVDCAVYYRRDGPAHERPLGETEFANGVAAMAASGLYGRTQACAGIVGHADLRRGAAVRELLLAHLACAGRRFKGVRHAAAWDAHPQVVDSHTRPGPALYADARFREGFAQLAPLGLSFDAWQYHTQLPQLQALAQAFGDTTIVLNHVGGPLGVGPYGSDARQRADVYARWRRDIGTLAHCPNVVVKLGGLGMPIAPPDGWRQPVPPSAQQLAQAWQPWILPCIEAFGAERCLFESNYPVDRCSTGYAMLWNAFKRVVAGASDSEQRQLFADTAARVYRLDEVDLGA